MQFKSYMEPKTEGVGELSKSLAGRKSGMDTYSKFQQAFLKNDEMNEEEVANDVFPAEPDQQGQNGPVLNLRNESSKDTHTWGQNNHEQQSTMSSFLWGTSPGLDESSFFGSDLLVAEIEQTSDAIEEMENQLQIKLMVDEAVLKGIVSALEMDASEAVMTKEIELQQVKEKLQEKDSVITRLIGTLQTKEDDLVKLVEESNRKERRLVLDMLSEREKVLAKVKETEKFVSNKEKEILKMAESMVDLAMKLDGESKLVIQLEKQLKEFKEEELLKEKEMKDKAEELRAQNDSTIEMVRREARFKELGLTDSLEERSKLVGEQLCRIEALEAVEQQLREELQAQSEKLTQLEHSGKDNAELLKELTKENKSAADCLAEKENQLKLLENKIELLKSKIRELIVENSTLDIELGRLNVDLDAKEKANVNQREEMEEQYEFETGLMLETCKGKVVDLAKEINLLGVESTDGQNEPITFQSKTLQRCHRELISLRSSKLSYEAKLDEFYPVVKTYEHRIELKDKMIEDKEHLARQAENTISQLEEELVQKGLLLENYKNEVHEMKSYNENLKKQQKLLEENVLMLREARDRISCLEQEISVNHGVLHKYKTSIEENSWRFEFKEMLLSTYLENSCQEFLKQTTEIQRELSSVGKRLACSQNELDAAQVNLSGSKAEVQRLKSDLDVSSKFVNRLQNEVEGYVTELSQARMELVAASSESEKGKADFKQELRLVDDLRKEFEDQLSKKRVETQEILEKLAESEWKSQAQSVVVLGLLEGSTHERGLDLSRLREKLKLKHQEVLSLRSEIEEQNQKLNSFVLELSALKSSLAKKDQEILTFRQETEAARALQQEALVQEQSKVKETLEEIEDLKKLKLTLVARIEEERERVQQLEEALADQKWKNQIELEMVTTLLLEGGVGIAVSWSNERAVLVNEVARLRQELDVRRYNEHECSNLVPREIHQGSDNEMMGSHLLTPEGKVLKANVEVQDGITTPPLVPVSIRQLERQNSELRREKEQLLEQKTDEIYKLKRDFYKELEKVKGEWKNDTDLNNLKLWPKHETEVAQEVKGSTKSADIENKLIDNQNIYSDIRVKWDCEKSTLLDSISQRDEKIKDVSNKLHSALEKEKSHVSTRLSLVENLAALEKERNRLTSVHEREKEKLTASFKRVLAEKQTEFDIAVADIETKSKRITELEDESCQSKTDIAVLQMEMKTIRKQLESDLAGQIQAMVASLQQLGNNVVQRMKQYNLRLEGAEDLVKCLLRQLSMLSLNEVDYMRNVHNLQKAETEVDLLGDEVDALMDILEKVYTVLNHYSPVIQHYPGLAELVKVVRQEILQRVYDSKDL